MEKGYTLTNNQRGAYSMRQMEILKGNSWYPVNLQDLIPGDIVRIFEIENDEWKLVEDTELNTVFKITSFPYNNENGKLTVDYIAKKRQ